MGKHKTIIDEFTDQEQRNAAVINLALLHLQNQILVATASGERKDVLERLGSWEALCKAAERFEGLIGLDDFNVTE
jgi:hypothetical protein